MVPVRVGGLDQQDVRPGRIFVVAQDRLVRLAQVAREEQPVPPPAVRADVELHKRGAQDVPGVEELQRDPRRDLPRRVQMDGREELHQRVHVAFLVERLEEVLALLAPLFVHDLQVALLQKARIP